MATVPTYPGVYIEEIPSGVRTITGVPTSITAFVGFAYRGPVNEPTHVQSFAEYEHVFGGVWAGSTMSYAVRQFFANGGRDALIVRAVHATGSGKEPDKKATLTLGASPNRFELEAANEGSWGNALRIRIDHHTRDVDTSIPGETATTLFNLFAKDMARGVSEEFHNVCVSPDHPRYVTRVLEQGSRQIRVRARAAALATRPDANTDPPPGSDPFSETTSAAFGSDGNDGEGHEITDLFPPSEASEAGIWALEQADLFNLLCVPPVAREGVLTNDARKTAANYCKRRRAFYIVDPDPAWNEPGDITADNGLNTFNAGVERENAALYFPRVRMADVVLGGAVEDFPPCGAVAGVIARTDDMGGVWKAPAGQDTTIIGAQDLTVKLTDGENGPLNALGVNCLRVFPLIGPVVWGARTLDGADMLASEWKYVPVRRLALFLEESLHRGTKWVVLEPNDAPLWAQIRLNVGTFMHNLFRQGAFQGATPREAYLVKCDEETTTQTDVDNGLVNIVIGFAPLKPAEFVIIKIQQLAGQIEA